MNKKIIILISLISGLALVFIFINPFWSSIKTLQKEIVQRKMEITKIGELLDKTQQLKQEYQKLEEEVQMIFLSLPQEKDIPHLLVQFDTLASANGLLLESIKFGQIIREKEKISQQTSSQSSLTKEASLAFPSSFIDISVIGSYSALKGYLAALESDIRLMDVYSIKFDVRKEGKETSSLSSLGIFEIDLGLNVYYQ